MTAQTMSTAEAVTAAQRELEAAQAALGEVERRTAEGDATLTPAELGEARGAVELAEGRLQAAQRMHAERAEAARKERVAELVAKWEPKVDPARLDGARRALRTAIEAWWDAVEAWSGDVTAAVREGSDPELQPGPFRVDRVGAFQIGGHRVWPVNPDGEVMALVQQVGHERERAQQVVIRERLAGRS